MSNFNTNLSNIHDNNATDYLIPSNLIPHEWYKKFSDSNGKSDRVAILVLSEIMGWYRFFSKNHNSKKYVSNNIELPQFVENNLSVSYNYLAEKLLCNKDTIRRAFIRLEKFGILKRETRNIEISIGSRVNKLFIRVDDNFFKSCFLSPELDIRVEKKPVPIENRPPQITCNVSQEPTPANYAHHIISKKNINLKIDLQSNFSKISFFKNPKTLKDFYPLSEEDGKILQDKSKRDFSLRSMNEILKDMGRRMPDRSFNTKTAFLNYMGKAFANEMRDAVKISNETFVILPREVREQENYLQQIENSGDPFKMQLANIFEREKAYQILNAYAWGVRREEKFVMRFWKHIELTTEDKAKILEHANNNYINKNGAGKSNMDVGEALGLAFAQGMMKKLEIIMPKRGERTTSEKTVTQEPEKERKGAWGKVYQDLTDHYSDGIMQAWFSKLDAEIDEEEKMLILKAPSNFVFNWINTQEYYRSQMDWSFDNNDYEFKRTTGDMENGNWAWIFHKK